MRPLGARIARLDSAIFGRLADQYLSLLADEVRGSTSVLDVGCGEASPLSRIGFRIPHSVGVDGHAPTLAACEAAGIHDEHVLLDVRALAERFGPDSFDCVVALDVLEHLPRRDGLDLLTTMERIATRKVVVFTPNGFLPQRPDDLNPMQQHLSGWTPEDLATRGFAITGVNGLKPLRTEHAKIAWRPEALWRRASWLSNPVVARRPSLAFQLLCVKELS